jgi:hypothetical protein
MDYPEREYTGTVYIGVVGTPKVHVDAYSSIQRLHKWAGDEGPIYQYATKGFEARQRHIDKFLQSRHDFILLLDSDQTFPADTLDRLRHWRMPYVTGLYMFRSDALRPIWFEWQEENRFPMIPYFEIPPRGQLVKLGASGWGCMLVHRSVFEAVEPLLKGEPFVAEDDMDIWPYDLSQITKAIKMLEEGGASPKVREAALYILKDEIKPLRVVKDNVGSDLRFPYYAREAGFTLYGDPDVRCGHMIHYPVSVADLEKMPAQEIENSRKLFKEGMVVKETDRLAEARKPIDDMDVSELIEAVKDV